MKNIILLFFLTMNNICTGQILNGSFESWTYLPNVSSNSQPWSLNDWIHCYENGEQIQNPITSLFGTYKDSTAQSGSFALTLSRWYFYTFDMAKFRNKCNINPSSISGFYKYTENILSTGIADTAQISVYLTKLNSNNQTIDTIGSGKIDLASANNYTIFDCPILYTQQNLIPDSIEIVITPTRPTLGGGGCSSGSWCSYLTVDNISLTTSTSTTEADIEKYFSVFPNPASSEISIIGDILHEKMRIFNTMGALVCDKIARSDNETLDTHNFNSGLYFLIINGTVRKFVIK